MIKKLLIFTLALLPLSLIAQEQRADSFDEPRHEQQNPSKNAQKEKKSDIFSGFSGGMMIHGGYLFADSPEKVFSNSGLGNSDYLSGLPKDGFTMGLGGTLRVHLIDHIHVGAEGFVSTMPMMSSGSSLRSGWGGAICDYYTDWGKVRPLIGLGIGGGVTQRLFVPKEAQVVTSTDSISYNASYTKTPFFYLDPYIGLEVGLKGHMSLLIRIDYLLPFGKAGSILTKDIKWGDFMSPNGPRLHIGVMFGKF